MSTNRLIRIVIGLALIGYAIYSGNAWFYLGVLPLLTGLINWCPLEMKMGTCDPVSGCCASTNSVEKESACCAPKVSSHTVIPTSFKAVPENEDGITQIEILGTGCSKCIALEEIVTKVTQSMDGSFDVKKVADIEKIMSYGVVSTPGLVINGIVVSTGKLLTADEVTKLLKV